MHKHKHKHDVRRERKVGFFLENGKLTLTRVINEYFDELSMQEFKIKNEELTLIPVRDEK